MNTSFSLSTFDQNLRAALRPGAAPIAGRSLVVLVGAATALQGATMGSYALWNGGSAWFILFAALKVPLFLGLAAALCFPTLRVLAALLGLGDTFPLITRALLAGQAAFALILASLAPFTFVFYASGASYRGAFLWNLGLFVVAAIAAQRPIRQKLAPLWGDARGRQLWIAGFALWAFVAVQLAWNLRPFLGSPDAPVQFLRPDAFTNAYLGIWETLTG